MNKVLDNKWLSLIVRLVLGGIFVFWSLDKITMPDKFVTEIMNYRLLPEFSVNIFAIILPWVELLAGIMLIAGIRIKANSAVIGLLLIVFIVAITSAIIRGFDIGCGCSSSSPQRVGLTKILEDLAMLIGAVYLFFFPNNGISVEKLATKESINES